MLLDPLIVEKFFLVAVALISAVIPLMRWRRREIKYEYQVKLIFITAVVVVITWLLLVLPQPLGWPEYWKYAYRPDYWRYTYMSCIPIVIVWISDINPTEKQDWDWVGLMVFLIIVTFFLGYVLWPVLVVCYVFALVRERLFGSPYPLE